MTRTEKIVYLGGCAVLLCGMANSVIVAFTKGYYVLGISVAVFLIVFVDQFVWPVWRDFH